MGLPLGIWNFKIPEGFITAKNYQLHMKSIELQLTINNYKTFEDKLAQISAAAIVKGYSFKSYSERIW